MAVKIKKWEEYVALKGETIKCVSYADYFARRPLFSSLQIINTAEEEAENVIVQGFLA